jgi:serine/threonine protein phosphatase PrpC
MSNQEIVDIVKQHKDPSSAAANIIDLAEQYCSQDNCTAMVGCIKVKDRDNCMHFLQDAIFAATINNNCVSDFVILYLWL